MRKVAAAVKQLQDEMPQFITFGMSHYYSEPKRVRFGSARVFAHFGLRPSPWR